MKKNRPNSAKGYDDKNTKEPDKTNHIEEVKEIMNKLNLLKSKKAAKSQKVAEIDNQNHIIQPSIQKEEILNKQFDVDFKNYNI